MAAGLAERTVRIAGRQGQLMFEMDSAALREVDLSPSRHQRSLTRGSCISKSDRRYADGSSSHLQSATPRLASRGSMMSQTLHHRGAGLHRSCQVRSKRVPTVDDHPEPARRPRPQHPAPSATALDQDHQPRDRRRIARQQNMPCARAARRRGTRPGAPEPAASMINR